MKFTEWPFFDESHRDLHRRVADWSDASLRDISDDATAETRRLVAAFGEAGWLKHAVAPLEVRSLCLIRESFAYHNGIADFAFALQGLGSGPISLFGSEEQKRRYLKPVASGAAIAAFSISEQNAGSDVAAMETTARRADHGWIIDGEKLWTSNAGIADFYLVFARLPELGEKAYGAFVVDASTAGVTVTEQIRVMAPHVLGRVRYDSCHVADDALVGEAGAGLKIAYATLDVFRTSVAAAALGFARRALDEAVAFVRARKQFGKAIADFQLTQARIAEMAVAVDAAALLVYRAAWQKDTGTERITREAAMAKLFATEQAQTVIDAALQLHGGRGVVSGVPVERLYREIRALRIYEGTSEVQKLVIAGKVIGS